MSNLCNDECGHQLSRYFLSMVSQDDLQKIVLSSNIGSDLNEERQNFLLSYTILHPLAVQFPPSTSYTRLFLKWLMHKVEEAGNVISEKLYLAYADIIQNGEREKCYQHYILSSQLTITLEISRYLVSHSTTGLIVWEASKWLADWSMENRHLFKDKKIMEVGCGLGLTGLVLCHTCQIQSYLFSDNSPEVLKALHNNISLNKQGLSSCENECNSLNQILTNSKKNTFDHQFDQNVILCNNCPVLVVSSDWNTATKHELNKFQADILLAADTFYDPSQFDALVQLFHSFLTTDLERKVYIACTERNSETLQLLSRKIAGMKLVQKEMEGPQKLNFIYCEKVPLHIYELSL